MVNELKVRGVPGYSYGRSDNASFISMGNIKNKSIVYDYRSGESPGLADIRLRDPERYERITKKRIRLENIE